MPILTIAALILLVTICVTFTYRVYREDKRIPAERKNSDTTE